MPPRFRATPIRWTMLAAMIPFQPLHQCFWRDVFKTLCVLCTIGLVLNLGQGILHAQELTDKERRDLNAARDLVGKTAIQYRDGKYDDAAATLQRSLEQFRNVLGKMPAAKRSVTIREMKSLLQRIETAHALLQFQGVSLPPIRINDGTAWWDEEIIGSTSTDSSMNTNSTTNPKRPTASESSSDLPPSTNPPKSPGEAVSFLKDVAPILMANCNGCHLDADRIRGGLRMDRFAQLMQGGDEGESVIPGEGDTSTLVMRMRGEGGDLMPTGGRQPVPQEQIKLIAKWIDQGAKYDGPDPEAPLRVATQRAWLDSATTSEISRRRAEESSQAIGLVTNQTQVNTSSTDRFLLMGSVSDQTLQRVASIADELMESVESSIAGRASSLAEDYFHGKATIFVLPRQYDYSEFTRMVEERRLPSDWKSHFRYDGMQCYVTIIASESDEEDELRNRLASPLFSLAMATRGPDVPAWLARGVGESIANARVRKLSREAKSDLQMRFRDAAETVRSAKSFLNNQLPAAQQDALSIAVSESLMAGTRRRSFNTLVRLLNDSVGFEKAFLEAYRGTPEAYLDAFLKWIKR